MRATFARTGYIGKTQRPFDMAANTILYCHSYIRRQVKMLYVWYLKKRGDWDTIHEENDVIEMSEELASVKKKLIWGKHTCLVMRTEHPRVYEIR